MTQERIQATIPSSNSWHLDEVELKAKALGLNQTNFVIEAVEVFLKMDITIYKKLKAYSKGMSIPFWMVVQNMLIKRLVEHEVNEDVLEEFVHSSEPDGNMLTGLTLANFLKDKYE